MQNIKVIVQKTYDVLRRSDLCTDYVFKTWNSVRWMSCTEQVGDAKAELSQDSTIIKIYPAIFNCPHPEYCILKEFGLMLLASGKIDSCNIWNKKLTLPTEDQVKKFDNKLQATKLKPYDSYKELLSEYPSTGDSVDRLVAVHFINALIANNISISNAAGFSVYALGCTQDFANRKRYHSLIPLTSAYCPAEVHCCFGCAFADCVLTGLSSTMDKSVACALKCIIETVIHEASLQ